MPHTGQYGPPRSRSPRFVAVDSCLSTSRQCLGGSHGRPYSQTRVLLGAGQVCLSLPATTAAMQVRARIRTSHAHRVTGDWRLHQSAAQARCCQQEQQNPCGYTPVVSRHLLHQCMHARLTTNSASAVPGAWGVTVVVGVVVTFVIAAIISNGTDRRRERTGHWVHDSFKSAAAQCSPYTQQDPGGAE